MLPRKRDEIMHGRIYIFGFICTTLAAGCVEPPAPAAAPSPPTALGEAFDAANVGAIRGQVTWDGDVPVAEETVVRAIAFNPRLHLNPARYTTPHVPKVNPQNRGVENAVVYLRQVDPKRSKPWDHPKASVEFHDRQLIVVQGHQRSKVGFVRRGTVIDVVNRDSEFHNLRGRGAAFFAMPLGEANKLHERVLSQAGLVDLTCAAGYYWLHAHLFVAEHPYYARTDADGRFVLDQVPAGTYELVCWLPSWHVEQKEVDPETGITARLRWAPPREQTLAVTVQAHVTSERTFSWSATMIGK
jgi:hypothetical protein